MKLFSYIVTHDTGFSPNPFWGYCTLACCKPSIRKTARVGDWITGLTPKSEGNKLVYAMEVHEILPYVEYFNDRRFEAKIPDYNRGKEIYKRGDNIYKPLPNGGYRQLQSLHSKGRDEDPEKKSHDFGGMNVLISDNFYYFGSQAIDLPENLNTLNAGRGHKCNFPADIISAFKSFISTHTTGIKASPHMWPRFDDSWKETQ